MKQGWASVINFCSSNFSFIVCGISFIQKSEFFLSFFLRHFFYLVARVASGRSVRFDIELQFSCLIPGLILLRPLVSRQYPHSVTYGTIDLGFVVLPVPLTVG